jgi:hypothetical protein
MAVDERRRHALHTAAQRQLGEEEGDTLMELLPPVGWADVATKQDLAMLQTDLAALENRLLAAMHDQFRRQTMHLMTILVPSLLGAIVAAFTSARLG